VANATRRRCGVIANLAPSTNIIWLSYVLKTDHLWLKMSALPAGEPRITLTTWRSPQANLHSDDGVHEEQHDDKQCYVRQCLQTHITLIHAAFQQTENITDRQQQISCGASRQAKLRWFACSSVQSFLERPKWQTPLQGPLQCQMYS